MRWLIALILSVCVLFCGCSQKNDPIDSAISLRNEILSGKGCSFTATICADYGDKIYAFTMDCVSDLEGNLSFVVVKPDTISGITGRISTVGGTITFDDKVLAFQTLADGELSPVVSPWIFLKTIRSGYIRACTNNINDYQIEIDDTYEENALRLHVFVKDNLPVNCDIYWKGRRAISITVDNFVIL